MLGILPGALAISKWIFLIIFLCLRYFRKFSQLCIQALQLLNVHAGTAEISSPLDVRHFTASCDMSRKWVHRLMPAPAHPAPAGSRSCLLLVGGLQCITVITIYQTLPASQLLAKLLSACGHPKGVSTPTWSYTGLFCLVLLYVYDVVSVVHIQK